MSCCQPLPEPHSFVNLLGLLNHLDGRHSSALSAKLTQVLKMQLPLTCPFAQGQSKRKRNHHSEKERTGRKKPRRNASAGPGVDLYCKKEGGVVLGASFFPWEEEKRFE